jgi:hypothetical protein
LTVQRPNHNVSPHACIISGPGGLVTAAQLDAVTHRKITPYDLSWVRDKQKLSCSILVLGHLLWSQGLVLSLDTRGGWGADGNPHEL